MRKLIIEELNNRQVGHAIRAVNSGNHTPAHVDVLKKTKAFLTKNKSHKWNKHKVLHKAMNAVAGLADGVITRDNLIERLIEAIDAKQLAMGAKVEREHGDKAGPNDVVQGKDGSGEATFRKIARAHLKEVPDYYTRLAKMEKKGKKAMKEAAPEARIAAAQERRAKIVALINGGDLSDPKVKPLLIGALKKRARSEKRLIKRHRRARTRDKKRGFESCPKPHGLAGKMKGCGLAKDKNGYFVHTHRARCKSYPTPEAIPKGRIRFIASTG